MKKSVKSVCAAVLFLVVATPLFSFDDMDRQIGIVYLKNAAVRYLNGQYEEAESFLEKTSEFYLTSSDLQYLQGLIKLEAENNLNEASEYFQKAIKSENWILLEKKECVTDFAKLLFRKKEYNTLTGLVENESYPDFNDNDLMYLYLLSLRYSGKYEQYKHLLAVSTVRYSDDYRFALLYVKDNIAYRDDVLLGRYGYKNPEGELEVFLEAAMSLESGIRKIKVLEDYFARGGKDKAAKIEYYRLRGNIDDEEFEQLIKEPFFENPESRIRLNEILTDNELREKLEKAYSEYTGNIYYDFNDDGYYEELHLYENGQPVGVSIDKNQDGILEIMLVFTDGYPSELVLSDNALITIAYDKYPEVKELSISSHGKKDVYTFLKESVSLPVYEFRDTDDKLVVLEQNIQNLLADEDYLKQKSVKIASYTGGDKKNGPDYLMQEIERRDEMYSILKVYNEIMGNYIYQQYNERRIAGFGDLDYDNLIDLKEIYTEGELVSIEADGNKNGIYDFKLSFENDHPVSWWDFNEDGIYDCRQFRENGVLIKEYSSNFDGNFDIIERN